ncbi:hypothetical protein GUITHDRAFT_106900 [Guillardia theta CCMP2712]|uniref:Uncharacterized protein n=1 Tax=Guillardia theta (strain CCMP2712) TaxID=905079 RepID=L1JG36_GUITC|nr:hypothetical protein GUITHDRAFT_106900 [Guillardia theta CCMP2712]EKX47461.1 hypothetical protein GUITHDRAFT_106900 [Guillardia theta CCMP2712]|eukprot:XP_005834441.1 hypothetical protein GUITHDRAFT_106900 [Guillardia theta CCMP2712]
MLPLGGTSDPGGQPESKYVQDYFRALVWSPPVLGGRLQGTSSVYTSKDLEKIDRELDKAREEYMLLRQRWNVSIALGGLSLDDEKLNEAYKDALQKSLIPLVNDLRPGLPASTYPYYAKEVVVTLRRAAGEVESTSPRKTRKARLAF